MSLRGAFARNDEITILDAINNNTLPAGIALPWTHGSANDTPGWDWNLWI